MEAIKETEDSPSGTELEDSSCISMGSDRSMKNRTDFTKEKMDRCITFFKLCLHLLHKLYLIVYSVMCWCSIGATNLLL